MSNTNEIKYESFNKADLIKMYIHYQVLAAINNIPVPPMVTTGTRSVYIEYIKFLIDILKENNIAFAIPIIKYEDSSMHVFKSMLIPKLTDIYNSLYDSAVSKNIKVGPRYTVNTKDELICNIIYVTRMINLYDIKLEYKKLFDDATKKDLDPGDEIVNGTYDQYAQSVDVLKQFLVNDSDSDE